MDFVQVDVFAGAPYTGNPLAVFPDASSLTRAQMQTIAREMNLSETTFVTSVDDDSYRVRIFTPEDELPFAGHPTIGTAWVLRELGLVHADELIQVSAAGRTPVRWDGDRLWFTRTGSVGRELAVTDPTSTAQIARAVALDERDIGMEARDLGRSGRLMPAMASAGLDMLIVPVRDVATLGRCLPRVDEMANLPGEGLYCFAASGAGRVRARGLFPSLGIPEDPATGAAAAALGLFLMDRVGDIDFEINQGVEIGRSSSISVTARAGQVEVGGGCSLVLRGSLEHLP